MQHKTKTWLMILVMGLSVLSTNVALAKGGKGGGGKSGKSKKVNLYKDTSRKHHSHHSGGGKDNKKDQCRDINQLSNAMDRMLFLQANPQCQSSIQQRGRD